jgi:hypothetical protein
MLPPWPHGEAFSDCWLLSLGILGIYKDQVVVSAALALILCELIALKIDQTKQHLIDLFY